MFFYVQVPSWTIACFFSYAQTILLYIYILIHILIFYRWE
jgi:hypothetical protein